MIAGRGGVTSVRIVEEPMISEVGGSRTCMKSVNLADLYKLAPLEWDAVRTRLEAGFPQAPGGGGPQRHTCWLSTINPDGSPHVTGIGALWAEGSFWFETGERSRKGRNIARDPRCSLSLAMDTFDLVVEGQASRVTDRETVAARAAEWAAEGWPAQVDPSGEALTAEYSAPSAGPPPWAVYRINVSRATALATTAPGGATRWDFGSTQV
jgi:pyridoxamine 5'-phosphate oxidase-like protein